MLRALLPLLVVVGVTHLYTPALLVGCSLHPRRPLLDTRFSRAKFYLLMGWAPLSFLALPVAVDVRFGPFFVLAGLGGMAAETLVSWWWTRFFLRPVWTYRYGAVLGGRTSTLNPFPWMMGALLFLTTGRVLGADGWMQSTRSPWLVAAAALGAGALALVFIHRFAWPAWRRDRRFTTARFAAFCLPIAGTTAALAVLCDLRYALLLPLFALVGMLTEYGYGRAMSIFFAGGLWTYHHLDIDHGHSSYVTFPLWAAGGLYFHLIALALGLV